jgi:hypothetical protein
MRRSAAFSAEANHLVQGMAMGKLRVEFLAEFARPAGSCLGTFLAEDLVDVFNGVGSVK